MAVSNDECKCAFIKGIYLDKNKVLRCTTCYKKIEDRNKIPDFSSKMNTHKDDIKIFIIVAIILSLTFILLFNFSGDMAECGFDFYDNFIYGDFI